MDRIDFIEQNEFHIKSRQLLGDIPTPRMVSALIRTGFAKDDKQAVTILIVVICITLASTLFLIQSRSSNSQSDVVVDQYGQTYSFQEYINLVRQGKDPFLRKP